MRKPREIKVIETEVGPCMTPETIDEIHELFADLYFAAWLQEKNGPNKK